MEEECSAEPKQKRREWVGPLLIGIAVAAVFGRCVTFSFTNWDDSKFLLENALLQQHSWDTFKQLWQPGSIPFEQLYIPVTYLSYWLESAAFGLNPFVCHTVNLLLHLSNCLLLYAVLRHLRIKLTPALIAALLFAVHPLQAEAVSWCMGRKDLLATCLSLCSLFLFLIYSERVKRWQLMIPVGLLACLAMLAKPSALVLPVLLTVLAVYKLVLQKRAVIVCLTSLAVIAAILYFVNGHLAPPAPADVPGFAYRLLVAPSALTDAVLRVLLVKRTAAYYQWPVSTLVAGIKTAGLAIVCALILFRCRRRQPLLAPLLALVVAVLPAAAALIQYRDFFGADRYLYLPLIFLAWFIAATLNRFHIGRRPIILGATCVWLAVAGCLAFRASGVWRDSLSLWGPISAAQPMNSTAHNNLGNALDQAGLVEESVQAYNRAIQADPKNFKAWSNLADAYVKLGRFNEAITAGKQAVEISPGHYPSRHNLALALHSLGVDHLRNGRPEQAALLFRDALSVKPNQPSTINLLGLCFLKQRRPVKAVVCFRKALEQVNDPAYRLNLARALLADGQREQSRKELDAVLREQPENAAALKLKREMQSLPESR